MARKLYFLFLVAVLLFRITSGGFFGPRYTISEVSHAAVTHVGVTFHSVSISHDDNKIIPGSNFISNTFSEERNEIFKLCSDMDSSDELLLSFECGEKMKLARPGHTDLESPDFMGVRIRLRFNEIHEEACLLTVSPSYCNEWIER